MDIYSQYMPQLLLVLGLVLLTVEVVVLGFSTFMLFFLGLGCVLTAGLMYINVLEHSFLTAVITVSIFTAISAALLWQPLKRLQGKTEHKPVQQDFIGHEFVLTSDVSTTKAGSYRYSGIEWAVYGTSDLIVGTRVKVETLEVGKFVVSAAE